MVAHIELRKDTLDGLRPLLGLTVDAELARAIGVNQSSLLRVLTGHSKPGIKFVAGLLQAAGGAQWFEKLFTIAEDPK